jgi:hypothetical protein
LGALREALRLRFLRRRLLWRALRVRLDPVVRRPIASGAILALLTCRNEMSRLPDFLAHHRALGVDQFLCIDNGSTDGSASYLAAQGDVSLWSTTASYRAARFGIDWVNALLLRHGAGHWCLTLDADELFVFPGSERASLRDLTRHLAAHGIDHMAALMLDLYPQGPLGTPGQGRALDLLPYFDPEGYDRHWQPRYAHVSIRGGPRRRVFFAQTPERAPHLHKTPLIFWHWRMAYLSSTHLALPVRLNDGFAQEAAPTGALLHTKFLPEIVSRSAEERLRAEHFTHPERYGAYYDGIAGAPVLFHPGSQRYESSAQLEALGLIRRGTWQG